MKWWMALVVLAAGGAAVAAPTGGDVVSVSREARVCMSGQTPPAGTPVRITRQVCAPLDAKRIVTRCHETEVGRGAVVRADGPHCVIVELPTITTVQAGDRCVAAPALADAGN